jgi:hypothetical protein
MKSKCPSWRGEATVRPRRQGRRVMALAEAKREPLTEEAGRSGAGFGQEGQGKNILFREWNGRGDFPAALPRNCRLLPDPCV